MPCSVQPAWNAPLEQWEADLKAGQIASTLADVEQWISQHPKAEGWMAGHLGQWILRYGASPDKAKACLERALQASPNQTDLLVALGHACAQLGQMAEARQAWVRALQVDERYSPAYQALAHLLEQQQYLEEALAAWQQACLYQPETITPYLRLATLAQQQGQMPLALITLEQAASRWPEDAQLQLLLGVAYTQAGQTEKSEAAYTQAETLAGGSLAFHRMAGHWFQQRGEAVRAIQHWVEVLAQRPTDEEAALTLAQLLITQARPEEAVALLQRSLDAGLDSLAAWSLLAQAAGDLGDLSLAYPAFDQAMARASAHEQGLLQLRKALTVPVIYPNSDVAQQTFQRVEMAVRTLAKFPVAVNNPILELGATPFYLSYQDQDLKPLVALLGQAIQLPQSDWQQPALSLDRKPRLGLLSRYWRQGHAMASMTAGLFEHLDRDQLEIVWLALGAEEATSLSIQPQQADRILRLPLHHWPTLVETIRGLGLDGLLLMDCGMEPAGFYLSGLPLARQQATYWSAPLPPLQTSPTGLPEALSQPFGFFKKPEPVSRQRWREDFGLRTDHTLAVIGAPLYALAPAMDDCLKRLLLQHPSLILAIPQAPIKSWTQALQHRWEASWPYEALSRVRWLGRLRQEDWQSLVALSDVVIDSFPGGDPATSLLALGVGTPVVGLQSHRSQPSITSRWLEAMNLTDWTSPDQDSLLQACHQIFHNPGQARQRVETAQPLLFERPDWVASAQENLLNWLSSQVQT